MCPLRLTVLPPQAPLIANPAYKGPWAPRKVANPVYYEDPALARLGGASLGGVGVEVWTMDGGIVLDNVLVTRSTADAAAVRDTIWRPKFESQVAQQSQADRAARAAEAEEGGILERMAFWASELLDLAQAHPWATLGAIAVALTFIMGSCVALCWASRKDEEDALAEEAQQAAATATTGAGRRAPHVNAAGAEDTDDDVEPVARAPTTSSATAADAPAASTDADAADAGPAEREATGAVKGSKTRRRIKT